MKSPDGRTLASPQNLFGQQHLALQTLLDDGTVIETAYQRRGGVRVVPPPRVSHRAAGYDLRRVTRNVRGAVLAHQQHIRDVKVERGASASAHDDIHVYMAINNRATNLLRVRMFFYPVAIPLLYAPLWALSSSFSLEEFPGWFWLVMQFGVLGGCLWLNPGRWFPMRRVPRVELLAELRDE